MGKIIKNGIDYGGGVAIDSALDATSMNAIANKPVAEAITQLNNDLDKLKVSTSNIADEVLVINTDIGGSVVPFTLNESRLYRLRLRPDNNDSCYVNIYHANDDELIYGLLTNLGASASTLVYLEAGNYRYGSSNNMAKFVLSY